MDKQIEELRAQRDLIQQHLEWINRQLAEAEGTQAVNEPNKTEPLSTETEPLDEAPTEHSSTEATKPIEIDDNKLKSLAPPLHNDLFRAKIGCLLLFALGIGLFLFLLFGLPYLID
ncbi:MAG: hypothetical protein ACN4GF_12435 [Lentimonas sp.]